MNKQIVIPLQSLAIALALLTASTQVYAVDGQVLINMSKAAAGGTTPGDAPGFPVTISRPGSYKLSGNLTVSNANTGAILITASHVTLDLNGFAILGDTNCAGGFPCAGSGTGNGISTGIDPQFNITIRNGTIQGMGHHGIFLVGDSHLIEYMHVRSNGASGIQIYESADNGSSIVQYNTAERNDTYGIYIDRGAANHNVSDLNGLGGIIIGSTGTASYNVATRNAHIGLALSPSVSFLGNTLSGNGVSQVNGGVNMGQNLCNNVVCPGALY